MAKKYSLYKGVVHTKLISTKKKLAGIGAGLTIIAAFATPAFAANDYCGTNPAAPGNGPSNGCAQSQSNTQCAGHGAFGAFGKDNSLAGGANGYQTGLANSELCGNRQGNLP